MRQFKLVYNPVSGRGMARRALPQIELAFSAQGARITPFCLTMDAPLDAFVNDNWKTCEGILVLGGDGTLAAVLNSMIKQDIDLPICIVPVGTGNTVARVLKLPGQDYLRCARLALFGKIEPVDVGRVNDRYFINVTCAGVLTSIAYRASTRMKRMFGGLAYVLAGFREILGAGPIRIRLTIDGRTSEDDVLIFFVFNGSGVQIMTRLAPDADIQDGLFDYVAVKRCHIFAAVRVFLRMACGRHLQDKHVMFKRGEHIIIEKLSGECRSPDTDGEPGPEFPLEITCLKRKIRIFT